MRKVGDLSKETLDKLQENTENANLIIKDLQNKLHKGMTDKRFSVEGTHWMITSAIHNTVNLLRNLEEMRNIIEDSECERWKKEGRWRE
ncbi:MAG: hypothetical protein IKR34_06570 [Candidatus Gastranaerophilales bacterium]|nr:hypothetical protein [Candidatus Gastranaerophilales bacterium]